MSGEQELGEVNRWCKLAIAGMFRAWVVCFEVAALAVHKSEVCLLLRSE